MKLAFETATACRDYAHFGEVYLSDALNTHLVKRGLVRERVVLESVGLSDGRHRTRVRVVPDLHVPRWLWPHVGDRVVCYEEVALHDPRSARAHITIETPVGDLVRAHGVAQLLTRQDELVLCFDGEVSVAMPVLGPRIERAIVDEVQHGCARMLRVIQEHVACSLAADVSALPAAATATR